MSGKLAALIRGGMCIVVGVVGSVGDYFLGYGDGGSGIIVAFVAWCGGTLYDYIKSRRNEDE